MPLIEMLFDINQILNDRAGQNLTAVDATDICNLIGKTVVAGNVRRSAELALGSSDNQDFITMKQDKRNFTTTAGHQIIVLQLILSLITINQLLTVFYTMVNLVLLI